MPKDLRLINQPRRLRQIQTRGRRTLLAPHQISAITCAYIFPQRSTFLRHSLLSPRDLHRAGALVGRTFMSYSAQAGSAELAEDSQSVSFAIAGFWDPRGNLGMQSMWLH